MTEQPICAVIPAGARDAGPGLPTIMLEVADGVTVWHLIRERLGGCVAHVHVILPPGAEAGFRRLAGTALRDGTVSVSVQPPPAGTGPAVFGAAGHWAGYDAILVVRGDQANLSAVTAQRVVRGHRRATVDGGPALTIPLVPVAEPDIEYEFAGSALVNVRQSPARDRYRPNGLHDIGVFCLSTGGLVPAWARYLASAAGGPGAAGFLPFLPYLSRVEHWPVAVIRVADPAEARRISTAADLEYARRAYRGAGSGAAHMTVRSSEV